MLELRRVPNPTPIWDRFFDDIGPETAEACYAWGKGEKPRPHEENFVAVRADDKVLVGWASLMPDYNTLYFEDGRVKATEWYLAIGVWPQHQRRGHRVEIRALMAAHAIKYLGAQAVTIEVAWANERHLERCWRELLDGGEWIHSGTSYFPSQHERFTYLKPFVAPKPSKLDQVLAARKLNGETISKSVERRLAIQLEPEVAAPAPIAVESGKPKRRRRAKDEATEVSSAPGKSG